MEDAVWILRSLGIGVIVILGILTLLGRPPEKGPKKDEEGK